MSDLVEVGDTIVEKTILNEHKHLITRVTKTLAFSKRKSDGHEYKFKRLISNAMAHPYYAFDSRTHKVIRNEQNK